MNDCSSIVDGDQYWFNLKNQEVSCFEGLDVLSRELVASSGSWKS
jgi:hypothetical protein